MSNKRGSKSLSLSLSLSKVVLVLPALFVFLTSLAFSNANIAYAANGNPWQWSDDYTTLTLTGFIDETTGRTLAQDTIEHEDTFTTLTAAKGAIWKVSPEVVVFASLPSLQTVDFSQLLVEKWDASWPPTLMQWFSDDTKLETVKLPQEMQEPALTMMMFANCTSLRLVDLGAVIPSNSPDPMGEGMMNDGMFMAVSEEGTLGSIQTITEITMNASCDLTPGEQTAEGLEGTFFDYKTEPWYAYQNGKYVATITNGYEGFRAYQETHPGTTTYYYGEKPGPEHTGWVWEDDGWRYYAEDGSDLTDGWEWVADDVYGAHWYYFYTDGFCAMRDWIWDGAWYYIQGDCAMACGSWNWIDGAWYGFNWDGTMCTGWIWDNSYDAWYYCYSNGVMARNTRVDRYWVDDSGRWIR